MGRGLVLRRVRRDRRRATGRPISWTALLAGAGGPGLAPRCCSTSPRKLLDQGLPVHPQVSCRPLNFEFTMAEPFPFESMRLFAPVSARRPRSQAAIYRDPEFRRAFREKHRDRHGRARSAAAGTAPWSSWFPPDPSLEERHVADAGRASAASTRSTSCSTSPSSPSSKPASAWRSSTTTRTRSRSCCTDPHTMLGLSDAGAHASQLCDSCFSTHLLGHWVRDARPLTLEEAVRKLTSRAGRGLRHHRPRAARRGPAGRRRRVRRRARGREPAAPGARPAGRRRPPRRRRRSASTR